jgi:hypothetical protein
MSEQSPEKAKRSEEPEVEGHQKGLNEDDPSVFAARSEERDGDDPEVEGHLKALSPEDPSFKAKQA